VTCDVGGWLVERGGKNAKKSAVVAVARKLAVLFHHLWKPGEVCDPFYLAKNDVYASEAIPVAA
jgi:hypothetical protein